MCSSDLSLPRDQLDLLGMLGLLQDVGKLRLPEELLSKKEPLTDAEIKVCRSHVRHSVAILRDTVGLPADLPALAALHHERYDGSGYPGGLRGEQIGLFGAIAGIVDCFDALTRWDPAEIREHADDAVVDLITRLAVEEIDSDEESAVLAQRVVVNLVESAARRLLATMLRREDDRAGEVVVLIDSLANARGAEHWDVAEDAASQLVAWIADDEEAA